MGQSLKRLDSIKITLLLNYTTLYNEPMYCGHRSFLDYLNPKVLFFVSAVFISVVLLRIFRVYYCVYTVELEAMIRDITRAC